MNKEQIIEKFEQGLSCGKDYATVELLIDKNNTKDNELHLQTYDANLMGLPPVSNWSKDAQTELKNEVIKKTKSYNIDVIVDGVVIVRRK